MNDNKDFEKNGINYRLIYDEKLDLHVIITSKFLHMEDDEPVFSEWEDLVDFQREEDAKKCFNSLKK